MNVATIRKRIWQGDKVTATDIGELARDLAALLEAIPDMRLVQFDALYAEPMFVAFDHEPALLICGRVRVAASKETVIACGGMVNCTWTGSALRVDNIDGLTPSGTIYTFNMLAVG